MKRLYCISGMATDARVFHRLADSLTEHQLIGVQWEPWFGCAGLRDYARCLRAQIEDDEPFDLLGVSMGGMLALEISHLVNPDRLILVSSAIERGEFPARVNLLNNVPLHRWLTEAMVRETSRWEISFSGVRDKEDRQLYMDMLARTGSGFLKWQIDAVANWEPPALTTPSLRIHGKRDGILPIRNINRDRIDYVLDGTHKLIINQAEKVADILEGRYS